MNSALNEYMEGTFIEPPAERVGFDEYHRLSRFQIDQGVVALVHVCNLTGGSVGDVNIYKLMRVYLLDADARAAINAIVEQ